jgi:hypothetical protein
MSSRSCGLALALALGAQQAGLGEGKGAWLAVPAARQVVLQGAFLPPTDLGSLDGGGAAKEKVNGHDVCGGTNDLPGSTSALTDMTETGVWGATPPQGAYTAGGPIDITVRVDDHRYGHFEFRLCLPSAGESKVTQTTQSCLNSHVLKFDKAFTTTLQPGDTMRPGNDNPADFAGKENVSRDHSRTKCKERQKLYTAPFAPAGSCCSGQDLVQGGKCSPEEANEDRWLLPDPNGAFKTPFGEVASEYKMRYLLPAGVSCSRCTLQMYYQQGYKDSQQPDAYPRGIWNCADISIAIPPAPAPSKLPLIIGGAVGGAVLILLVALCVVAWKKGLRCCVVVGKDGSVGGGGGTQTRRQMGGSKESYTESVRNTQQQEMGSPGIGGRFRDMYQRVSMRSQALMGGGGGGAMGGSMRSGGVADEQQPERLAAGRGVFLEPMGDALLRSVQSKAKPPPPPMGGGRAPPTPPPPPPPDADDYDNNRNPRHSLDV